MCRYVVLSEEVSRGKNSVGEIKEEDLSDKNRGGESSESTGSISKRIGLQRSPPPKGSFEAFDREISDKAKRIASGIRHSNERLSAKDAEIYDRDIQTNLANLLGENGMYCYTMMGECYVHGMMDGEAMRCQNERSRVDKESREKIFEIR